MSIQTVFSGTVRNRMSFVLAIALLLACLGPAIAGGFGIRIALPDRQNPRMRDALLVVRCVDCSGSNAFTLTATAEGIVDGQRKSVSVAITTISKVSKTEPFGTYAIKRQWPTEGAWVLVINAKPQYKWAPCHALVELEPNGSVRMVSRKGSEKGKEVAVQYVYGDLKDEVDTSLRTAVQRPAQHNVQTIASGVH